MPRPAEHPVRRERHNQTRKVIRYALLDAGVTTTWLAEQLGPGISRETLEEKLAEDGDGTLGPHDLQRVCDLVPLVAERLGITSKRVREPEQITEHAARAQEASAALGRALFKALADGRITGAEAETIAKAGEAMSEEGRNVTAAARAAGDCFDKANGRGRA